MPSEETERIRSPRVTGAIWLGKISFFCWAQEDKATKDIVTSVTIVINLLLISEFSILCLKRDRVSCGAKFA